MIASGTLLSNKYRIESLLGRGGSGIVYAARQEPLGRPVAVKVLRRDLVSVAFLERFRREAEAAAALQHPNLVQVTDLVTEGEHVFLVMERLVGASLSATIVKEGALAQARLATIGSEVLAGLSVAHAAGLVHRDVKPDNVFLQSLGQEDESAKLLDFGIVKRSVDADALTEGVIGTWQYMPPEQSRGDPVDGRADVYSLGASLFYAATGLRPYQAAKLDRMTFVLSPVHAPPLASLRKDFDPAFCAVIDRALVKEVAGRWPGASAMRAALAPFTRKRLPGKIGGTVRLGEAPRASAQVVTAVAPVVSTKRAPVGLEDDSATVPSETSESSATRDDVTAMAVDSATTTQGGGPKADLARTLESAVADDELATVKSPPIDLAELDARIAAASAASGLPQASAEAVPASTVPLAVPVPVATRPRVPPPAAPAVARAPGGAPTHRQRLPDMTPAVPRSRARSLFIAAILFVCVAGLVAIALYMRLHVAASR